MGGYFDENGEIDPKAPPWSQALILLTKAENRCRGLDLQIARLEADRELAAQNNPLRPEIDLVHACWKRATGKRRPLHFTDVENIGAAVKKLGLRTCLQAVVGLSYDPHTRRQRNGDTKPYNDLETAFKSYGRVQDYADRAPKDWEPNVNAIAEIGGVEPEWVKQLLNEKESK